MANCIPRAPVTCDGVVDSCGAPDSGFVCASEVRRGERCAFKVCRAAPPIPGAPGMVKCAANWCTPSQLCLMAYDGGGPRIAPTCIARDAGLPAPNQFGNLMAYCDSDDDCLATHRCAYVRGENDRIECVEETSTNCPFHANHVCSMTTNCHQCDGGGAQVTYTCRSSLESYPP